MPRKTSTVASAGVARDPEGGESGGERRLLHADPAGNGRDASQHPRADLHADQLGEVEALVERQEAEAEQRGIDEVAGDVAAEQEHGLLRVADHGPDVGHRCLTAGTTLLWIFGTHMTTPIAAATSAITQRLVLSESCRWCRPRSR